MSIVLVVDDEPTIRDVLIEFLAAHGYDARGAADGREGLALAKSLRPQMILLDIAMPGMDGIETLRHLRREVPEAAVVMISGHADQTQALQSLELGAFDFIQKPLDFRYLERTLLAKIVTLEPGKAEPAQREEHGGSRRAGKRSR